MGKQNGLYCTAHPFVYSKASDGANEAVKTIRDQIEAAPIVQN